MNNNNEYFHFKNKSSLYFSAYNLRKIIKQLGTPTLIYFTQRFEKNHNWLFSGLSLCKPLPIIAYPVKAAQHIGILSEAVKLKMFCEVMTEWEYNLAIAAGFLPSNIILNGFGWSLTFISNVVNDKIFLINIDNISDLKKISKEAKKQGKIQNIGIRVIPEKYDIRSSFASLKGKLGVPIITGEADNLIQTAQKIKSVRCICISAHILHRTSSIQKIRGYWNEIIKYAQMVKLKYRLPISLVDLGGGLDEREELERRGIDKTALGRIINHSFSQINSQFQIILEPGRFLIGDAGVAITRIINKKSIAGNNWLIIDAASNFLIPIEAAHFDVFPIKKTREQYCFYSIGDNICSPQSIIRRNVLLPGRIKEGDFLAIGFAGAYTFSMAENWGYPLPTVAMINNGEIKCLIDSKSAKEIFEKIFY